MFNISISVNLLEWVTGTKCLSVGGIPSTVIGLLRIIFATFGASPAGCLGPNPYHPSKVTNIPPDQICTQLLWNIWLVASYQFVLMPLTNSYNQDPAIVGNIAPPCLLLKYS